MSNILQTKNLIKHYEGVHAVDHLSIEIEKGGYNSNKYNFTHVMLHEIFHYIFKSMNESRVERATQNFMNYYNLL